MSLKNSWHTELAIYVLLSDIDQEDKLDLLTNVGLSTKNKELFKLTESIRSKLCDQEMEESRTELLSGQKAERIHKRDMRKDQANEMDEGK